MKSKLFLLSKKIVNWMALLIPLVMMFVWSYFVLKGGGYHYSIGNILLLTLFVIASTSSRKFFYFIGLPVFVLMSLYYPVGVNYGIVSVKHVSSLLATDVGEAKEFFSTIPIKDFVFCLFLLLELVVFYAIQKRYGINYLRNKTFVIVTLLFLCVNFGALQGPKDAYKASREIYKELKILNNSNLPSKWEILSSKPKYKNYVLVIGESVRRDYMGVYGYYLNNTPFVSSVNGVVLEGLTGSDTYTIGALRVMLTKTTDLSVANYSLSLMDLAKDANYSTAWISNQGYLGKFDTQVSVLAKKADKTIFLKYGDYVSNNLDDVELLPYFKKELDRVDSRPKLIVLHLMGSHVNPCERLHGYPMIVKNFDPSKKLITCYVTSIKKTDDLIKQIYSILQDKYQNDGQSFSMIYTSDHGLCMQKDDNGNYSMTNGCVSKWHRDLPLIKISSDDNEHKHIKSKKYSNNFVEGMANWMAIQTSQFPEPQTLFNDSDQKDDLKIEDKVKLGILDGTITF